MLSLRAVGLQVFGQAAQLSQLIVTPESPIYLPKGPSSPYFWVLVPIKAPKSLNNEYLDPYGLTSIGALIL